MPRFIGRLLRRKSQGTWFVESPLKRCMNLFDLTVLGLGSLIDSGIYLVIGRLAATVAGPSVIISFLIAAVAAGLAGLSYAELSSRITKTGSAYVFTYVILGEIWAFIAGWSMLAEYLVNAASMARACTYYIDSITGGALVSFFIEKLNWGSYPPIGEFPDFVALTLVILATIVVALGVRESKTFMDVILVINISAIAFSIVAGIVFSDPENWSSPAKFAPYGLKGILLATPSCFYCLSGFDIIPTASEEALDPRHDVPVAIILALGISTLAYFGIATVLTMMIPYQDINYFAPLAEGFKTRGLQPGYYIVSIGALGAMFGSLLSTSYAVTRLVYSLAYDGLISACFAKVNKNRQVPLYTVFVAGILIGLLAFTLDMDILIDLVALSTICTYTLVSICVLLSRYTKDVDSAYLDGHVHSKFSPAKWLKSKVPKRGQKTLARRNYQVLSQSDQPHSREGESRQKPNSQSVITAVVAILIFILSLLGLWTSLNVWWEEQKAVDPVAVFLVCLYGVTALAAVFVLYMLPQNDAKFPFMVPMAVPLLSILLNMFVLVRIHRDSYIMYALWIVLGLFVYCGYGFVHSTESFIPEEKEVQTDYAIVPDIPMGTVNLDTVQQPYRQPRGKSPFADD